MKQSLKKLISKINILIKRYPILKEGFLYGIIGLTTSTIDSLTFFGLRTIGINLFLANFIGINVGITLSFFAKHIFKF